MRPLIAPARRPIWTPPRRQVRWCPVHRRPALNMAAGDVMLDTSGNVILDASGNVLLDDGAGNACCCNPVVYRQARRCDDGTLDDWWMQVDPADPTHVLNGATSVAMPFYHTDGTDVRYFNSGDFTSTSPGTLGGGTAVSGCPISCIDCPDAVGTLTSNMAVAFGSGWAWCDTSCQYIWPGELEDGQPYGTLAGATFTGIPYTGRSGGYCVWSKTLTSSPVGYYPRCTGTPFTGLIVTVMRGGTSGSVTTTVDVYIDSYPPTGSPSSRPWIYHGTASGGSNCHSSVTVSQTHDCSGYVGNIMGNGGTAVVTN